MSSELERQAMLNYPIFRQNRGIHVGGFQYFTGCRRSWPENGNSSFITWFLPFGGTEAAT